MSPTFVHLHLHSEYSLTDSTLRIAPLVQRCAELGLPAVAVTDTSNLFALVKFFKAAEASGLKPIAGADLWVADEGQAPARVTVLCLDHDGFLSLSRLITRAFLEGHRGDFVAVRPDWLLGACAGLVLLAGRESPIGQALANTRARAGPAARLARRLPGPSLPRTHAHRPRGRRQLQCRCTRTGARARIAGRGQQ